MSTVFRPDDFYPPPQATLHGAMLKALAVHALLALALAWGVSWRHQANTVAFEAELWSAVPQQAAPAVAQPVPEVKPPEPKPVTQAPVDARADIKVKAQEEKKRQAQIERELEKTRLERMQKMVALAGKGEPNSSGQAQHSSGPSANYAARIRGRIIPNITFPDRDTTQGNPTTVVQFRIAPDGTILGPSIRVIQASGNASWDKAVVNAVEKTQQIPRDVDGRFPDSTYELKFRVRE
jgi:colicin import membrane protein